MSTKNLNSQEQFPAFGTAGVSESGDYVISENVSQETLCTIPEFVEITESELGLLSAIGEDREYLEQNALAGDLHARQFYLANMLYVADDELARDAEACALAYVEGKETRPLNWKNGLVYVAIAAASTVSLPTHAGGINVIELVQGQVDRGLDAQRRIGEINRQVAEIEHRIESNFNEIEKIEIEKKHLLIKIKAEQSVDTTTNSVSEKVRPLELENRYEMDMARLTMTENSYRERLQKIAKPTPMDIAQYDIKVREIQIMRERLKGEYEIAKSRNVVDNVDRVSRTDMNVIRGNERWADLTERQARLERDNQRMREDIVRLNTSEKISTGRRLLEGLIRQ
jgi:hypothetical protein